MILKYNILLVLFLLSFLGLKAGELDTIRHRVIQTATQQLNVIETSKNRSIMIDIYNSNVGVVLGSPWCASFVSYVFDINHVINPHSAYSPDFAKKRDIVFIPKKNITPVIYAGDVFTLYYTNLGRVGHTGIIEGVTKDGFLITIEGNTNNVGSREGDRVMRKKRDINKVYAITRYIK